MPIRRTLALLLMTLALGHAADDEVFQWCQSYPTAKGEAQALLWIPPAAARVRGVLVAGSIPVERRMTIDPAVRAACAERSLAVLSLATGLGGVDIPALLTACAGRSGYAELATAPLAFFGHSAGGPQARAAAAAAGSRCFALVQHRGGIPAGEPAVADHVVALVMAGQFDEFGGPMRTETGAEPAWQRPRDALREWRAADPATRLAAFVVEPGAGHFAWSAREGVLLARFLSAAAAARIPAEAPETGAPTLRVPDAAQGWLLDLAFEDGEERVPVAAAGHPDPGRCAWFPERALAEATAAFLRGLTGRKDRLIRWEDRHWVDAGTRYFFQGIAWGGDGTTFTVRPAWRDAYPAAEKNGPSWPAPGSPLEPCAAPILVRGIGGPIEAVGPATLQLRYSAIHPATASHRPTFLAYAEDDGVFRHSEQVGMMPRGFKGLTQGREQAIAFAELPDLPADAPAVALGATSDAGLPVRYHIAWGPAVVDGSTLRLAPLPPRAALPIEVAVVAWQSGSGIEPKVRTATPVLRTFRVVAPTP